jgi:hypothetical protein
LLLSTGPEEHAYVIELDLYDEIDKEDVKEARTDRTITLAIAKKESGPHWPRLIKANGKAPPYVKVNWDKWVDEDEEDEAEVSGHLGPAQAHCELDNCQRHSGVAAAVRHSQQPAAASSQGAVQP